MNTYRASLAQQTISIDWHKRIAEGVESAEKAMLQPHLAALPSGRDHEWIFPPRSGLIARCLPEDKGLAPNDGAAFRIIDAIARFVDWGRPTQELRSQFLPRASGWYRLTLKYANTHGPINTGITAAVKTVTARCGGEADQVGSVAMPHLGELNSWGFSTGFFFQASGGEGCELRIGDGFNMSYLSHFARYTGGQGGVSGVLNRGDIAAARVELIRSEPP
jgi:hypothetical protein